MNQAKAKENQQANFNIYFETTNLEKHFLDINRNFIQSDYTLE